MRVPALIDPETWELAQAQLARNRERSPRHNTRHAYLLRGLLACGRCGRRLVGYWGHPTDTGGRYVCSARSPRSAPWHCDGPSVAARRIEAQVWAYVRGLLGDPALLKARYLEGQADPTVDGRALLEQARLTRKIQALGREVQRLIDAYQQEVIELAELQERRQRIDEHGRLLRERLCELQQQRREREDELRLMQGLDEFCSSVREALEEPPFEVKQAILRLVVDYIVVEDTRLVIHHVVPAGPVRLQTDHTTTGTGHIERSDSRPLS